MIDKQFFYLCTHEYEYLNEIHLMHIDKEQQKKEEIVERKRDDFFLARIT